MKTVKLEFVNEDATPKRTTVHCNESAAEHVMLWYKSHHDGDKFKAYQDGKKVIW